MTGYRINLIGNTYGRLTVIDYAGSRMNGTGKRPYTFWRCECTCSKIIDVRSDTLKRVDVSCGCFKKQLMASIQRKCWSLKEYNPQKGRWRRITIEGKSETLGYWSKQSGISIDTIRQRLNRGWDEVSAVFTPVKY